MTTTRVTVLLLLAAVSVSCKSKDAKNFLSKKMLLGARIQTADISTWVDLSVLIYP